MARSSEELGIHTAHQDDYDEVFCESVQPEPYIRRYIESPFIGSPNIRKRLIIDNATWSDDISRYDSGSKYSTNRAGPVIAMGSDFRSSGYDSPKFNMNYSQEKYGNYPTSRRVNCKAHSSNFDDQLNDADSRIISCDSIGKNSHNSKPTSGIHFVKGCGTSTNVMLSNRDMQLSRMSHSNPREPPPPPPPSPGNQGIKSLSEFDNPNRGGTLVPPPPPRLSSRGNIGGGFVVADMKQGFSNSKLPFALNSDSHRKNPKPNSISSVAISHGDRHRTDNPLLDNPIHRCKPCAKEFRNSFSLEQHCLMQHVTCPYEGCDYSAKPDSIISHKVVHLIDKENHEGEIDRWIRRRLAKHPSRRKHGDKSTPLKGGIDETKESREGGSGTTGDEPEIGVYEKAILLASSESRDRRKKAKQDREHFVIERRQCLHFARYGKCRDGDKCAQLHLKRKFCTFFSKRGNCMHENRCTFQHVRNATDKDELQIFEGLRRDNVRKEIDTSNFLSRLVVNDHKKLCIAALQCLKYIADGYFTVENVFKEEGEDGSVRIEIPDSRHPSASRSDTDSDKDSTHDSDYFESDEIEEIDQYGYITRS